VIGESSVGGRLMDELVKKNFKTSTNSVNTHAHAAAGDPALGNPTRQVSTGTPQRFNRDRTLGNLTSRVSELNGMSSSIRNNVFAETWSEALTQAMMELEEANAINENPDFAVANFRDSPSGLDKSFQATARYIKARKFRNVDRELFVIEDGGYDMHECNCVADKLSMIDAALRSFRDEMKAQGLWDKVVIVTGIDFGRVSSQPKIGMIERTDFIERHMDMMSLTSHFPSPPSQNIICF